MSIPFKLGRYVDASGMVMAYVDIPSINSDTNISLSDESYMWEENISSKDSAIVEAYVGPDGLFPPTTASSFLISNIAVSDSNDLKPAPLYYKHSCRFYHYSYGENPVKAVYITDQYENILKRVNYKVVSERISKNVYRVDVLTDFHNGEFVIYKIKYNRCLQDGSQIYPSWTETLNAQQLFSSGNPTASVFEYSASSNPDGLYYIVVPEIPTLSNLINTVGLSFENSPTLIYNNVENTDTYDQGVIVTYTLRATSFNTFTIRRNYTRDGTPSTQYLYSVTYDSWNSSPYYFSTGTEITGIPGVTVVVNADSRLQSGDEAYFTASKAYYYLKPISYETIYLSKPMGATPDDDWYLLVKNGRFRRRMDASGSPAPSGYGTLFEYALPEFDYILDWNPNYGSPYRNITEETAVLLDQQTIGIQHTPIFIDASSVLGNSEYPGFPPSGSIAVSVNDTVLDPDQIIDWDINNGTIKTATLLSNKDDINVSYVYKEEYALYEGFVGSGGIYPSTPPFPFEELNLNPSSTFGHGMYASGMIASVYLKPYYDVESGVVYNSNTLYHNFTGEPDSVYDLKLGSVSLGPNCGVSDVKVTDVRTRGGGLSDLGIKDLNSVEVIQPETKFFWDIGYFDGQAVPTNGVIVVKIPRSVLSSNGGSFSEDEVVAKVKKHMALGEFPIIEYT